MRIRRSGALLIGLAVLGAVVLSGLGAWQLARHGYKAGLERERAARVAAPPLAPAEAAALHGEELDWRRLRLDGEWDYARAQVIANRTRFGLRGEEVVVPLRPEGGGAAVLVNRGWYPADERAAVLAALPEGGSGLAGLIRHGRSLRATRGADGAWTRFDVASIAATLPYEVVSWRAAAGKLAGRQSRAAPPERPVTGFAGYENTTPHLEYALTWFGLAAAMLVTAALRLRRGGGRRGAGGPPAE